MIYDILIESIYGNLSNLLSKNILLGFILFIISEIIIFSSIFFSYLYRTLFSDIVTIISLILCKAL